MPIVGAFLAMVERLRQTDVMAGADISLKH
jgi:hypothetical protein